MPNTLSLPAQVREFWRSPDGAIVQIRPIERTNATLIREFVGSLSQLTLLARAQTSLMHGSMSGVTLLCVRVTHLAHSGRQMRTRAKTRAAS